MNTSHSHLMIRPSSNSPTLHEPVTRDAAQGLAAMARGLRSAPRRRACWPPARQAFQPGASMSRGSRRQTASPERCAQLTRELARRDPILPGAATMLRQNGNGHCYGLVQPNPRRHASTAPNALACEWDTHGKLHPWRIDLGCTNPQWRPWREQNFPKLQPCIAVYLQRQTGSGPWRRQTLRTRISIGNPFRANPQARRNRACPATLFCWRR